MCCDVESVKVNYIVTADFVPQIMYVWIIVDAWWEVILHALHVAIIKVQPQRYIAWLIFVQHIDVDKIV